MYYRSNLDSSLQTEPVHRTHPPLHNGRTKTAVLWLLGWLATTAHATCIELEDPGLRILDEQLIVHPANVLERAQTELRQAPSGLRAAALQALISEAYYQLERDQEARSAAQMGIELLQDQPDPALRIRLHLARAQPADAPEEIDSATSDLKEVMATLPSPSRAHTCTLITTAHLQQAANRLDLSVADAISAYREASTGGWSEPKALAAEFLGWVYADSGDTDEAHTMLDEAIRYAETRRATLWLSVLRFGKGRVRVREHDWNGAIGELREAISLSKSIHDTRGVAFARSLLCSTLVELGNYGDAGAVCGAAEREISATDRPDLIKDFLATRAKLELARGQRAEALRTLNLVLDQKGRDLPPRDVGEYYLRRAQTYDALGEFANAYQDLSAYVRTARDLAESDRRRSITVMRTRLETDRALENGNRLQHENEVQRLQLRAQSQRILLSIGLAGCGFAVAGMLAYLIRLKARHTRELGKKEAELRTLVLNSPDWLMLLDPDLTVRFNNRTSYPTLPSVPIGAKWQQIFPPQQAQLISTDLAQVVIDRKPKAFDFDLVNEGMESIYGCEAVPVLQESAVVGLVLRCTDATASRRREELLRTQAIVLDKMQDGVLLIRRGGAIRLANSAFYTMIGRELPEPIGINVTDFGLPRDTDFLMTQTNGKNLGFEFSFRSLNGSEFQAHAEFSPVSIAGEDLAICIIQDISERKRLEAQLIEIANREQIRIASDLHDGVGQELTGVSLLLRSLVDEENPDSEPQRLLHQVIGHVNSAIENTRTLAQGLAPLQLDGGNLCAALRHLAWRTKEIHGLDVHSECHFKESLLAPDVALHLYRIAQEAISNVVKHARARQLAVNLASDADQTVLSVRDDGVGMPSSGSSPFSGMGLQLMQYRARLIGGILRIQSGAEAGTEVSCAVSH